MMKNTMESVVVLWQETQMKWEEYEEIASSLLDWLQNVTGPTLDRNLPTTYNELKVLMLLQLLLMIMIDHVICLMVLLDV